MFLGTSTIGSQFQQDLTFCTYLSHCLVFSRFGNNLGAPAESHSHSIQSAVGAFAASCQRDAQCGTHG